MRLLISRRATRWEAGRFVVEGPKLVGEALDAGAAVETVFIDTGAGDTHRDLAERASARGARILDTAPGVLTRACDAATAQPIAAVVEMLHRPLGDLAVVGPDLAVAGPDLVVVCVGLQDPGNAGTVLRSAAASGAGAVVFCSGAVDVYNPKAVRASAGALFHVPVVADAPAGRVLDEMGNWGLRRIATVARGGRPYDRVDLAGPCALVLGSESRGLPAELAGRMDEQVTIPMISATESLNVAMAATIVCFEAARQRRVRTDGRAG